MTKDNAMATFISLLPIISAAGALIISVLVYRRQKTVDNENHFFNFKLDQYYKIIESASSTLEIIYKCLHDYKFELEEIDPDEEMLDEAYEEVNEKMMELRVTLHKACAFIPKSIVGKLDEIYDETFSLQEAIEEDEPRLKEINKAITLVDEVSVHLDEIINLMRSDMGIENIDLRLKKRAR
jgi:hypothetical protein